MKSQNEQIKNHLQSGKTLTALQALRKFNCLRLSGRIYDLTHNEGLKINSTMINCAGKRIAEYSIENEKPVTSNQ